VDESLRFLDPQTLASLQGLDLAARLAVEGYVSGLHKSPYHGVSVEFAEHREYVPGDDLRHVDWKVWSRTDKLHLKQYEQETNLITYLQQQDSVGMATFNTRVQSYLRPSGQPSHLKDVFQLMAGSAAGQKTDLAAIFHDLAERFRKRGLVVLISDLFDDPSQVIAGLRHFRHRRHDAVVFHVLDPAELDFPFKQTTLFKGLEALGDVIAEPASLRRAYQIEINSFCDRIRKSSRAINVDYVQLRTDQRLDVALSEYLAARTQRLARAR
jgi:uncharacterized protein (DUF58 family)